MLAHTLGNPVNIDKILQACDGCGLWSLFDCCDGLGGTYKDKPLTSYGDAAMSMLNFYINRAGKNLDSDQKLILERAKNELRALYGRK